ncbi:Polyadenylate-binding protein 2 [Trichinella murrelli]|nr:Polyadenylate-binding protein 2 [Trichinella murrelli]
MDEVGDVDDFGDNLDIGVASDEETLDQSSDLDPEIEEIRARLKEMEKEAQLIRNLHTEVEKQMSTVLNESPTTPPPLTSDEKVEADSRSVFVGNVDYGAAAEELEAHFHGCGAINRITILCDRYSGRPKGFAYIEFADKESARASLAMSDTLFRGRQIKVVEKRTNRPGMGFNRRRMRGRVAYRYLYSNRRLRYRLFIFLYKDFNSNYSFQTRSQLFTVLNNVPLDTNCNID